MTAISGATVPSSGTRIRKAQAAATCLPPGTGAVEAVRDCLRSAGARGFPDQGSEAWRALCLPARPCGEAGALGALDAAGCPTPTSPGSRAFRSCRQPFWAVTQRESSSHHRSCWGWGHQLCCRCWGAPGCPACRATLGARRRLSSPGAEGLGGPGAASATGTWQSQATRTGSHLGLPLGLLRAFPGLGARAQSPLQLTGEGAASSPLVRRTLRTPPRPPPLANSSPFLGGPPSGRAGPTPLDRNDLRLMAVWLHK